MQLRRLLLIIILLEWVSIGGGSLALAKKVKIEWKPIDGASEYEIQIQRDGGSTLNKHIEDTIWSGDLESGSYSYQIRGIDRAKRPGLWTELRTLAVMPPPPKPKFPADGSHISLYHPDVATELKWEGTAGIKTYFVDIRKEGKLISHTQVNGTQMEVKGLPPGKYSWQVKALLIPSGRSPASQEGKKWESEQSREEDFKIEYKQLDSPRLVDPVGSAPPPEDGFLKFRWKSVDGAELYEIHILRTKGPARPGRSLASDLEVAKRFATADTSLVMKVPGEGKYVWGVRALANLNEKKVAQATGPESTAQFNLDRNAVFNEDLGYLAFSTMLAPYQYQVSSPSTGGGGSTSSWATVFRLSGELWFRRQWGIAAGVDYANFTMLSQSFAREAFELLFKYRMKVSSGQYGWSISPKLGAEVRDYNEITAINNNISNGLNGADNFFLGASAGVDIRKQFNEKLSLGVKLSYFLPLSILSAATHGSALSSVGTYSNISAGVQGLYWLNRNWGLGLGGFYDVRSISFTVPNSAGPEEVHMDATYFFGSIIYRFWK